MAYVKFPKNMQELIKMTVDDMRNMCQQKLNGQKEWCGKIPSKMKRQQLIDVISDM